MALHDYGYRDDVWWRRRNTKFFVIASMALVIFALVMKTTLAANITLTSGSPVEFGQGIVKATACSGATALTVTPEGSFKNESGAGAFYLKAITVSNIPSTCYGSQFTLNAYGNSSNTALALYNVSATDVAVYDNSGVFVDNVDNSYMTLTTNSASSFTATFVTPVAISGTIYKLTIQSSVNTIPTTCQGGASCVIGDVSPDGVGHVFYVSVGGFACGPTMSNTCHYLSVAPQTWAGGSQDVTKIWSTSASSSVPTYNGFDASSTAIGYGLAETNAIIHQAGGSCTDTTCSYAAGAARNYHNASENWYLPNLGELQAMLNSSYAGNYASLVFFSSSESSSTTASILDFSNTNVSIDVKSNSRWVRPIRAF